MLPGHRSIRSSRTSRRESLPAGLARTPVKAGATVTARSLCSRVARDRPWGGVVDAVFARVGSTLGQAGHYTRAGARVAAVLVATVLVLALPVVGFSQSPTASESSSPPARTVTLITGDRVTLRGNEFAVRPARGRAEIVFEHYRERGHHYVIP